MTAERELWVAGVSHHTAPVAAREQVAMHGEELEAALAQLKTSPDVAEAMIVSTCNRTEIYFVAGSPEPARALFLQRSPGVAEHLYLRGGASAMQHLFRVCASLDSMVVGEPQILGQVKDGLSLARGAGAAGAFLTRACSRAFTTAKRVRSETSIGKGRSSVAQASLEVVRKIFGTLRGRTALVVGAGETGALAGRALLDLGPSRVLVTNRSQDKAEELAKKLGGAARPLAELDGALAEADVVLVATGAPDYVVAAPRLAAAMKTRRERPLCIFDLSMPRNVDPACGKIAHVFAYDLDDLARAIEATRAAREEEARHAERIVEEELAAFAREEQLHSAPVLVALRKRANEIARLEAERTLARVGSKLSENERQSIASMAQAIVGKLLHLPTARLRDAAASGDEELPSVVLELFGLEAAPRPPPEAANAEAAQPEAAPAAAGRP